MRKRLLMVLLAVLTATFLYAAAATTAPASLQAGVPVYGLTGRIDQAPQAQFQHLFRSADGRQYLIVGVNAAMEQRIADVRDRRPAVETKIWGTFYEGAGAVGAGQIVVTDLLVVGEAGTGGPAPQAEVAVQVVNVRSGPSTAYALLGQARRGEVYDIVGRSSASARPWWYICCLAGNREGWISGDLVIVRGDASAVPVVLVTSPTRPTPQPPVSFSGWRVSYFNNTNLNGTPAAYDDVPEINFNWGAGSPHPLVQADNFSIRYERTLEFAANTYQFNAQADDGIRVWLNGELIIDAWHGATGQTYRATRQLSGQHRLRVEYFEALGDAWVRFWWTVAPEALPPAGEWRASYFNDIRLAGAPLIVRNEPPVRFMLHRNWSLNSPVPGVVPADNWSARWVGRFQFATGNYYFEVKSKDGARLYLDGHLVIEDWNDGDSYSTNTFERVGAGLRTVTIEYYKRGGLAWVEANWAAISPGGFRAP